MQFPWVRSNPGSLGPWPRDSPGGKSRHQPRFYFHQRCGVLFHAHWWLAGLIPRGCRMEIVFSSWPSSSCHSQFPVDLPWVLSTWLSHNFKASYRISAFSKVKSYILRQSLRSDCLVFLLSIKGYAPSEGSRGQPRE